MFRRENMTLRATRGRIHSKQRLIFFACFSEMEPLTLSDGSVLQFLFDASYQRRTEFLERHDQNRRRRNVENFEESFSINVRVKNDDGFLWQAQDNLGNFTQLHVSF